MFVFVEIVVSALGAAALPRRECFAREFDGWTAIGRSTPRSRYSVEV